jgi:hypothetical protein
MYAVRTGDVETGARNDNYKVFLEPVNVKCRAVIMDKPKPSIRTKAR